MIALEVQRTDRSKGLYIIDFVLSLGGDYKHSDLTFSVGLDCVVQYHQLVGGFQ